MNKVKVVVSDNFKKNFEVGDEVWDITDGEEGVVIRIQDAEIFEKTIHVVFTGLFIVHTYTSEGHFVWEGKIDHFPTLFHQIDDSVIITITKKED